MTNKKPDVGTIHSTNSPGVVIDIFGNGVLTFEPSPSSGYSWNWATGQSVQYDFPVTRLEGSKQVAEMAATKLTGPEQNRLGAKTRFG